MLAELFVFAKCQTCRSQLEMVQVKLYRHISSRWLQEVQLMCHSPYRIANGKRKVGRKVSNWIKCNKQTFYNSWKST